MLFLSFFFPCSRFSAAVRKDVPPADDAAETPPVFAEDEDFLVAFGLALDSATSSSSSSKSSSSDAMERLEEAEEDDFADLTDLVSASESEGTMKSSSSDAAERLLRSEMVLRADQ